MSPYKEIRILRDRLMVLTAIDTHHHCSPGISAQSSLSGWVDVFASRPIVGLSTIRAPAGAIAYGEQDMNASALQRFGRYPLYISTPIAAVIAAVVTGIAHLIIGDLLGGVPDGYQVDTPTAGKQDLVFGSSMFATFLYVLIGGVVYAIVRRFARDADRVFVIVAVVVTILSFIQPLTLDAPTSVKVTLILLHIIAAIVATSALIALTRPRAGDRPPAEPAVSR